MDNLSHVKQLFIDYVNQIIINSKVSHAYLIEVDNYEEDFKYIYDFIKMILCNITYDELNRTSNKIIDLVNNNNYPDIKEIGPDGSFIKKNQLIELQSEFNNKSLLDNKRIYIIREAEKLNQASANTILKFLEEPEDDIIAFLVTTNRYSVIETIISRCQILSLKDNTYNIDITNKEDIVDFLDCILNPNTFFIKYNDYVNNYISDKNIMNDKLKQIENLILAYLDSKYLNNSFLDNDFVIIFDKYDINKIINTVLIIEEYLPKLEYNVNYKLWLDSLFARLVGG